MNLIHQKKYFEQESSSKNKSWNSERVAKVYKMVEEGIDPPGGTPFYEGDSNWKAAEIVYDYTDHELVEITKCATDAVYFANNYCQSMTDKGIQKITLRDYQVNMIKDFQNHRFNICLSSRQSGKTVSSGIFIAWYLLFNSDKNTLVLANKGATAVEILDKIKTVLKGLPFFLKPGIITNNQQRMVFDNGCKIMASSTSGTAAIGFTIHLAYMDEFAHIHNNFVESFYRSVYPTISSSKVSRVIITSTPNGKNKFFEIYQAALDKKNEYNAIRVDWWQVPDRDEKWKQKEISQLGNEELFNQEYGNQFLSSDTLLLQGSSLKFMEKIKKEYVYNEIEAFDFVDVDYNDLKWHPDFKIDDIKDNQKFVLSIDIGEGAKKDYSVINILTVEPLSKVAIKKLRKERVENEAAMFRLRQVGLYKSNTVSAEEVAKIVSILTFKVFNPDNVKISVEINFKGDYFIEKISQNENYYEDMILHTKHNERSDRLTAGIKIHRHNKMFFCREFRKLVLEKRIILTENFSYVEMSNFGINNRGSYSSQIGHDDIAMSFINLVPFMTSEMFSDLIDEIYDDVDENIKKAMQDKIVAEEGSDRDDDMINVMKSIYDENPFKNFTKTKDDFDFL